MKSYVVLREIMIWGVSLQKGDILVFDPKNQNRLSAWRGNTLVTSHTNANIALDAMTRSRQIEFLETPVSQEVQAAALNETGVQTPAAPTAHAHEIVNSAVISESLSIHPTPAESETERSISSHGSENVPMSESIQTELTHADSPGAENGSSVTEQTPVSDSVSMKVTRNNKKKSE